MAADGRWKLKRCALLLRTVTDLHVWKIVRIKYIQICSPVVFELWQLNFGFICFCATGSLHGALVIPAYTPYTHVLLVLLLLLLF